MDNTPPTEEKPQDPLLSNGSPVGGSGGATAPPADTTAPLVHAKKHIEPINEAGVRQVMTEEAEKTSAKPAPNVTAIYKTPEQTTPDPNLELRIPTQQHATPHNPQHHSLWDGIRGLFGKRP